MKDLVNQSRHKTASVEHYWCCPLVQVKENNEGSLVGGVKNNGKTSKNNNSKTDVPERVTSTKNDEPAIPPLPMFHYIPIFWALTVSNHHLYETYKIPLQTFTSKFKLNNIRKDNNHNPSKILTNNLKLEHCLGQIAESYLFDVLMPMGVKINWKQNFGRNSNFDNNSNDDSESKLNDFVDLSGVGDNTNPNSSTTQTNTQNEKNQNSSYVQLSKRLLNYYDIYSKTTMKEIETTKKDKFLPLKLQQIKNLLNYHNCYFSLNETNFSNANNNMNMNFVEGIICLNNEKEKGSKKSICVVIDDGEKFCFENHTSSFQNPQNLNSNNNHLKNQSLKGSAILLARSLKHRNGFDTAIIANNNLERLIREKRVHDFVMESSGVVRECLESGGLGVSVGGEKF